MNIKQCPNCQATQNGDVVHVQLVEKYQVICSNCGMAGPKENTSIDAVHKWDIISDANILVAQIGIMTSCQSVNYEKVITDLFDTWKRDYECKNPEGPVPGDFESEFDFSFESIAIDASMS